MGYPARHLTGQRFGRLLVKGEAGRDNRGRKCWECVCDCGETISPHTVELTGGRVTGCARCEPRRAVSKTERTCIVCGSPFLGDAKALVCSNECRRQRRRGHDAGVEFLPTPEILCVVCGKPFPANRNLYTCSDVCLKIKRRKRWREGWEQRVELDPEITRRMARRRREKAARDPEYAEKVKEWEARRHEKHRLRMAVDPAYAAKIRARANAHYAADAEAIQESRRQRLDTLSPSDLKKWMDRARAYGRHYRARWREELAANPEEHCKFLDLMHEYRRRRQSQKTAAEAIQLARLLAERLGQSTPTNTENEP